MNTDNGWVVTTRKGQDFGDDIKVGEVKAGDSSTEVISSAVSSKFNVSISNHLITSLSSLLFSRNCRMKYKNQELVTSTQK